MLAVHNYNAEVYYLLGKDLLASGSLDRLIHVFDNNPSNGEYSLFSTLDEHSASITSVKFAQGGSKILSSGADKSITFSQLQVSF